MRRLVLTLIDNIIEDTFIEAAACSVYDNLEQWLQWFCVALCFGNALSEGTLKQKFSTIQTQQTKESDARQGIMEYLEYMAVMLLYPILRQAAPSEILSFYIEATKELFLEGSMCGIANKRNEYTQSIFDIIEPLIPQDDDLDTVLLTRWLCDVGTHAPESASIKPVSHQGKNVHIMRRLFFDEKGQPISFDKMQNKLSNDFLLFQQQKEVAQQICLYQGMQVAFLGSNFNCASIHHDITVEVLHPKIHLDLRRAYQNIYQKYHINISSYCSRFAQLLKGTADVLQEKQILGTAISSHHLGDVKKRYWRRTVTGVTVPDVAILLLIDGSGSMHGALRERTIVSSVILHEFLYKTEIEHAIVELRAIYDQPLLQHNVLLSFSPRVEETYNLLSLQSQEGTREGLTLY